MIRTTKELRIIQLKFRDRLGLCKKIMKTNGISEDYTIKELLEDEL